MSPTLMFCAWLCAPTWAAEPEIALRPVTYPSNPRLTAGLVENFLELVVDPSRMQTVLKPVDTAGVTGDAKRLSLPVENDSSSWARIAINGTELGTVGPYTIGAVHKVLPGAYDVRFTLQNGYSIVRRINARPMTSPIVPGGEPAAQSVDGGVGGPADNATNP